MNRIKPAVMSLRLDSDLLKRLDKQAKRSEAAAKKWWPDNPLQKYCKPITRSMVIRAAIVAGLDAMERRSSHVI